MMSGLGQAADRDILAQPLDLPDEALTTARDLAQRVRAAIADMPFAAEPQQFLLALDKLALDPATPSDAGSTEFPA